MASSSSPPPPPPLIQRWTYDAFLSFRGEDTRKNFISHLFDALKRNGINVFKDDQKLERGKVIAPELLRAIKESRFSIVVLSRTYASSTWCLDELVQIVECKNKMGHEIFPIFYYVDPSEVRKQTCDFHEAFAKHEEAFKENREMIKRWRTALTEVGNISGWHLNNRHESDVIQDIVREISIKLSLTISGAVDGLIGIQQRLEELCSKICTESNDVHMIGICGMGGIGKTTLARAAYDLLSPHFEGKSFLANVREVSGKGQLVSLQKQLLSQTLMEESFSVWNDQDGANMIRSRLRHRKVLVILDDINHINQLKFLAGNHNWFGLGSKIIITSRDERLLRTHGVDDIYQPTRLNEDEALELFSLKAFKSNQPHKDYVDLCKSVVKYANGLPLALEVLGSFLYGRGVNEWKSALKRLKKDCQKEILDRLGVSFDKLGEAEKKIFLDIACFFNNIDTFQDFQGMTGNSVLLKRSCPNGGDESDDEPQPKRLKKILNFFRWGRQTNNQNPREITQREN